MAAPLAELLLRESGDDWQAQRAWRVDGAESIRVAIGRLWRTARAQSKTAIVSVCLVELSALAGSLGGGGHGVFLVVVGAPW